MDHGLDVFLEQLECCWVLWGWSGTDAFGLLFLLILIGNIDILLSPFSSYDVGVGLFFS